MLDLWLVFALATVTLVVYKTRAWRAAPTALRPSLVPVVISGVAVAVTSVLAAPKVGTALNASTGIPSLSVLLLAIFSTVWACSGQAMLLFWRHPPERAWRTARWIALYGTVIIVLETMLFITGAPGDHHLDFIVVYADAPWLGEMSALHYIAYSAAMANIAVMCWRWSLESGTEARPWLRRGLRITAVGILSSMLYGVATLIAVLASWADIRLDFLSTTVAQSLSAASLPVVIIGMTISTWAPRFCQALHWGKSRLDDLRDHRHLYPLWNALRQVEPALIHQRRALSEWNPRVRLLWRIIEINDWLLGLQPYRPELRNVLKYLTASNTDLDRAAAEAVTVRLALEARARHEKTENPVTAQQNYRTEQTSTAFASERRWLVLISQAMHSQPVNDLVQRHQAERRASEIQQPRVADILGGLAS